MELRRRVVSAIVVAGIVLGLVIYLTASTPDSSLPEGVADSKQFNRQMEVYGGKANLVASEIADFLLSLVEGPTLGITLAVFSFFVAFVTHVAMTPLPPPAAGRKSAAVPPNSPEKS